MYSRDTLGLDSPWYARRLSSNVQELTETASAQPFTPTEPVPPATDVGAAIFYGFTGAATGWVEVQPNAMATEQQRERHIIQTAWTELETEYFDDVTNSLRQLTLSVNGYIESEQIFRRGQRILNMTLRIPSANFQDVLQQVESLAEVRHSRQQAEDVTDQFYDTSARLETRRIEEERLLALIEEADYVHDLLELERRLSSTRLQIEIYMSQLTNLAGRIAYSTIFVTLFDIAEEEVVPIAGPTLGERIGGAFGDSVDSTIRAAQNFVIFIVGIIIPLLIWGTIGFVTYKVIRKLVRKFSSPFS